MTDPHWKRRARVPGSVTMAANVLRQLALDALSAGDVEDAWSIAQARRVVLETVGLDHQPIANLGRPERCPICEKRF